MKQRLDRLLAHRSPRERRILLAGAAVVIVALAYGLVWQPLQQARTRLDVRLPQMRGELAQMRLAAEEIKRLKQAPRVAAGDAAAAVEASAARQGLRDRIRQIERIGPSEVRLAATLPFDAWVAWIEALQRDHRLFLESCRVTATSQPGIADISATLRSAE